MRYKRTQVKMKLYGLLGKNISYSLSPVMHNAAFKELGIEAEYKLFDLSSDELDNFFERLKRGEILGCNVTIPYKEKALEYVQRCEDLVKSTGALNTISYEGGVLEGYNTDHEGFIKALTGKDEGDLGFNPSGKSVFLFGAGGAAKTVAFSLLNMSSGYVKKISIADIDIKKAERLACSIVEKQKGNAIISVAEDQSQYNEFISKSDLLVNATPSGMKESDEPLFDYRYIPEGLRVFDLIYAKETLLLKEALKKGAKAINGRNMLLYQAASSFGCWINEVNPVLVKNIMKKALLERIGL